MFWLDVNDTNIFKVYQKLINNYINGSSKTIVSNTYDEIYNNIFIC